MRNCARSIEVNGHAQQCALGIAVNGHARRCQQPLDRCSTTAPGCKSRSWLRSVLRRGGPCDRSGADGPRRDSVDRADDRTAPTTTRGADRATSTRRFNSSHPGIVRRSDIGQARLVDVYIIQGLKRRCPSCHVRPWPSDGCDVIVPPAAIQTCHSSDILIGIAPLPREISFAAQRTRSPGRHSSAIHRARPPGPRVPQSPLVTTPRGAT